MLRVFIQQPVIPAYRETFFTRLDEAACGIELHASMEIPGDPKTADKEFEFKFVTHECVSFLESRLFWQKRMSLPGSFGKDDVVVINSNPRFLSNFWLVVQAKRRGCKVVAWNHAMSSSSGQVSSWIRKKLTSWMADRLLLYTFAEVEMMKAEGWSEKRLFALNNTVDTGPIVEACQIFLTTKARRHEEEQEILTIESQRKTFLATDSHRFKPEDILATDGTDDHGLKSVDSLPLEEREALSILPGEGTAEVNAADALEEILSTGRRMLNTEHKAPIDTVRAARESVAIQEFKVEQGLDKKNVMLFCGRITAKTQLDVLIKALSEMNIQRTPNTEHQTPNTEHRTPNTDQLIVIGDGPEKEHYQQLAKELNVDEQISWLGAIYDEKELAQWFLSADCFVYPGSIGLSLNHAMSYGLPVITHDNSSNHMPEFCYLNNRDNGYTFSENSFESLAVTVENYFDLSETDRDLSSSSALKTVHDIYSFDSMEKNFMDAVGMGHTLENCDES